MRASKGGESQRALKFTKGVYRLDNLRVLLESKYLPTHEARGFNLNPCTFQ